MKVLTVRVVLTIFMGEMYITLVDDEYSTSKVCPQTGNYSKLGITGAVFSHDLVVNRTN